MRRPVIVNASTGFVVLAAICWGLSGGIGGILLASGWDALVIAFNRGAIGLGFVLVWFIFSPHNSGLKNHRLWFWAAIAGLGVTGNFVFYFKSIAEGSVAVAATLMYCAPVFVCLASFAFHLEKPTLVKWIAITMVVLGIVLLTRIYDMSSASVTLAGIAAGLLSGISYAVFIFGFKNAAPHGSPQAILIIAFAALVATLFWAGGGNQPLTVLSSPNWPLFAALGVLGAGLSFILYIIGLRHTTPVAASIVAMIEPVTASLFSVFVLKESLDVPQYLGIGLILITVTGLSIQSSAGRPVSKKHIK